MAGIAVNDEKCGSPPHWSKAARERGTRRFLHAFDKNRDMRQRLDETEDLIARTEEDYLRALLSGADLPPLSAIHAAAEALRMDGPEGWPRVSRGGRTLKPASDVTPSGCA